MANVAAEIYQWTNPIVYYNRLQKLPLLIKQYICHRAALEN